MAGQVVEILREEIKEISHAAIFLTSPNSVFLGVS